MFPRLDDIQRSLEIDKAELGVLLLCLPLGLQITLLFADRLVRVIPLRSIICLGIPLICFNQFAAAVINQIAFFAIFLMVCVADWICFQCYVPPFSSPITRVRCQKQIDSP